MKALWLSAISLSAAATAAAARAVSDAGLFGSLQQSWVQWLPDDHFLLHLCLHGDVRPSWMLMISPVPEFGDTTCVPLS